MQQDLTAPSASPGFPVSGSVEASIDAPESVTVEALHKRIGALELRVADQERELERRREQAVGAQTELLRVRDLLITAERVAGQVKGENESLQDQLFSYQGLLDRHHDVVNSTTWRIAWKLFAPYRKLRSGPASES